MPTYSYKCEECGLVFEELFKKLDDVTSPCIKCDGKGTRGWYDGKGPAIKAEGMLRNSVDKRKQVVDDGIPIGECPGDDDYKWMDDSSKTSGPCP